VRVEPIVAAAPGYSTYHARVLVERFADLQPRVAIFYVGGYNDHRPRRYFPDAEIPARMARRHAAWHGVRLLQSGELVANLVGGWITRRFGEPDERARVPLAAFEANVGEMLDVATQAGARSIVLIPPFSPKLRAKRPTIPRYEAILRERAAAAGATVIELGPLFEDVEVAFQRDRFHPSAVGHARIASALAEALSASD
jgi:lysophospholipase L1-like esterase